MKLADSLKKYRKRKRLTQTQLANKLYVSRKTISNWENGRSQPSFAILEKLSQLYNVSVDDLLINKSKKQDKKITISYYLGIILLILSYSPLPNFVPGIVMILLTVNVWFLLVNYKKWPVIFSGKASLCIVITLSIIFFMFTVALSFTNLNLRHILRMASPIGFLVGHITRILVVTVAFFVALLLSKAPLSKIKTLWQK